MNLSLHPVLDTLLDGRTKGYPQDAPALRLGELGAKGWRVLQGDVSFPCALLKQSALSHNARWMGEFLRKSGTSLCPHGKTTMAPQLFQRQLEDGAWGITVATAQQARVAVDYGVKRVLLANEVVHPGELRWIQNALNTDPALEIILLADSLDGVHLLEKSFQGSDTTISILVELGYAGGRTGARTVDEAIMVARAVKAAPGLRLRGVECYEGLIQSADAEADASCVRDLVSNLVELARRCASDTLFETDEILLSAGGSVYFDLVALGLTKLELGHPIRPLLRSGCYLTHDTGLYERLVDRLASRLPEAWRGPSKLLPALEVWSQVLSRPEPGLALLGMGKRDVAHDVDLPKPILCHRQDLHARPAPLHSSWRITALNDQHAYLRFPDDEAPRVGDLIGCGISHPCTTFDKWQLLYVVDDDYRVVEGVKTFF